MLKTLIVVFDAAQARFYFKERTAYWLDLPGALEESTLTYKTNRQVTQVVAIQSLEDAHKYAGQTLQLLIVRDSRVPDSAVEYLTQLVRRWE